MKTTLSILFFLCTNLYLGAQLSDAQKLQVDSLKKALYNASSDSATIKALIAWDNIIYISDPELDLKLNLQIDSIASINLDKNLDETSRKFFLKSKATSLNNIGLIYNGHGNFEDAIEIYLESLKIYEEIDNKNGIGLLLNNIGLIHANQGSFEKALSFYNQSLEIQKEIDDKKGIALALMNIGRVCSDQGNLQKALNFYNQSLKIQKEIDDKKGVAITSNHIGIVYAGQGNVLKAIEFYSKSLKIQEKIGNKSGAADALNNIGIAHADQGNFQKAIEFYSKSLKIHEENGNKTGAADALNNIGTVHSNQDNYQKAIEFYSKSLKIRQENGDKAGIALSLNNIGNGHIGLKEPKKAILFLSKALTIREEIGDQIGIAQSYKNIGDTYSNKANYTKAKEYYDKSLLMAQQLGAEQEIKAVSLALWRINKQLGRNKEALEMFELYIATRDSLESEENQKAVIRQEYKYAYEKQAAADSVKTAEAKKVSDAELKATKAENAQQKLKAEQEEQRKYVLYGVLTLAVLFGLFIFNRFRVTKKQRDIIDLQKQEVQSQKLKVDEAYDELEEKNTEILDSINYAKRIQSAILPPNKLVKQYLENSFILYKPKDIVAGDFYWLETVSASAKTTGDTQKTRSSKDEPLILFAAADCTGHGVPGAMVSVVCNNGLNRSVREYGLTEPGEILDKTREIVISEFEKSEEEVKDGMDVALCSLQGRTLKYAGAHNPLWIIRKRKTNETTAGSEAEKSLDALKVKRDISAEVEMIGEEQASSDCELIEVKAHKQPIGKYGEPTPYPTHTIELNEGDSFYIFSDGYADQFGGERGKKFKTANFKKLLLSIQNETIERQKELIDDAFENWKDWGGHPLEQLDDVCVIGVRV